MRQVMFGLVEDQDVVRKLLLEKQQNNKGNDENGSSNDVVFLDVRNPDEIAQSSLMDKDIPYIEGRYLLDNSPDDDKLTVIQEQLQKSKKLVVFCAKGGRAMKAIETLKKLGYTQDNGYDVYNAGGINDVLDLLP